MPSDYYDRRAPEYEAVYRRDDPVRQAEQAAIAESLKDALQGRRVLEIACGTGYWTAVAGEAARHVTAIDSSAEMVAMARAKYLPSSSVQFLQGDAYHLDRVEGAFDAGLANFWLSHVPASRVEEFLDAFHGRLGRESPIFMADNVYIPGMGGELIRRPGVPDTFKTRALSDGSRHEVLKNYYDADGLRRILEPRAADLRIHMGSCFWRVAYRVRQRGRHRT